MNLTKNNLEKCFDLINNKKIMVIGDVMLDKYIEGEVSRISPEAPVPVVNVKKRKKCLGGAANVALNLHAMGAIPILCGIVGDDVAGMDFIMHMSANKLSKDGIVFSTERPTTTKIRVIGNKMQLLRVDEEIDEPLSQNDTRKLWDNICTLLKEHDIKAIIFEDYDKGLITPALIENIKSWAEKHEIPICVDPKKRNFNNYRDCTLFKPNLSELSNGLNIPKSKLSDEASISENIKQLMQSNGHKIVMVTLSENGMMVGYYNKDNNIDTIWIPAIVRNVCDVSGAGDTVISIATISLALGLPTEQMAEISNIAGGLVCETIGVVPINKSILEKECKNILF